MLLSELEPGQNAIVESVGGSGAIRRHLLDMGVMAQKVCKGSFRYRLNSVGIWNSFQSIPQP